MGFAGTTISLQSEKGSARPSEAWEQASTVSSTGEKIKMYSVQAAICTSMLGAVEAFFVIRENQTQKTNDFAIILPFDETLPEEDIAPVKVALSFGKDDVSEIQITAKPENYKNEKIALFFTSNDLWQVLNKNQHPMLFVSFVDPSRETRFFMSFPVENPPFI